MDGRRCLEMMKLTVSYPAHQFPPEDLLYFIESKEFSEAWDQQGFNLEEDLISLQLCIMNNPYGDLVIDGTGGLRKHHHSFSDWGIDSEDIAAYYAYFEDYGIVYLNGLDECAEDLEFTAQQREAIRAKLVAVETELDRLKTIH